MQGCYSCCFFRLVEAKGKQRRLCMLTGRKKPFAGMDGCRFVQGAWTDIDAILGLPKCNVSGNTGDPNQVKLVTAFFREGMNVTDKNCATIGNLSENPIFYTRKGSFVRPGYREAPVAHLARERTRLPF